MEVCFLVTFRPQEVREYSWDLVCSTEREKFLVPLRAVGPRPLLTLPDEVDFGPCPIKSLAEKKLMVQNVGSSTARFTMRSLSATFSCPEQDIIIEAGASYPIILTFTPLGVASVMSEIELLFSSGIKCYIALKGFGKNVEVSLSTPSLTLEPSYISLLSQKTLKIRNSSTAPVSYRWKSFSTEEEEEAERGRLLIEINRIEEEERAIFLQRVAEGFYDRQTDYEAEKNGQDYQSLAEDFEPSSHNLPFAARVDEGIISRKYRNLRKALEMDTMLFVDDIFDISALEGEVWPNSETEVTVVFRPDTAAMYNCLAFLEVSGRQERLPLQLSGQGIGPHAALSFDVLDIGDVFVNDVNDYELTIKNKGDIPAQWTFMSSLTKFGNKFKFAPTDGYLLPNQSQNISIRFESDILGEFSEFFRFALQGNENMLVCQIKGHVLGPTFHFDCNSIDFGTVSYDCLHTTQLRLTNTSKVPMVYNLHVPQDGTYVQKEFNIQPSRGTLSPNESMGILLEFIPTSVKIYDYSLAVDVLGVGDVLLSIPIKAECIVSQVKVELPARELDFGDCFIRYPYEQDLIVTNLSLVVQTKFEVLEQPKQTRSVVSYETDPAIAVIPAGESLTVKVRLVGIKLGSFKVPLTIAVAGSIEPPLQTVLAFNTVGPKIIVECTELKWGNIECLKDYPKTLKLTNVGPINASMKIFTKLARSCYRIEMRELVLEAHRSHDLVIVANLDDSVVTKDEVHIIVDEGDNLMVPLIAKGIGTTMFCKHGVEVMDLGVQLTNMVFEKQIVLENKGRRPQQLKWHNKTLEEENSARLAKAKKLGKDPSSKLPKNLAPVEPSFTVTPEEITLRSRTATTFTFRGFSATPRILSELFILESKVGKERYMRPIIQSEVRCEVVNPLLEFSAPVLDFEYIWEKGVEPEIRKRSLVLKNISALPLTFLLKTEIPFNLSTWDMTLFPDQEAEVIVEFDPVYRDDKQSHIVEKTLVVTYRGHPQKDCIALRGEVVFPNLKFDMNAIQFGCILNDTSKTLKLRVSNCCRIDAHYEWIFLEQAAATKSVKARAAVLATPPSHVFDILPVKSMLQPDMSEDVEFTIANTNNTKISGTVCCVVTGGPEYKFPISAESSNVSFLLDKSIIDFGKVVYTSKVDQEFGILNDGRVAFNYEILPCSLEDAKYLEFLPSNGKVGANQKALITVRMKPAIPDNIKASFAVRIAQFDPIIIDCFCQGIFPTVFISLPRYRKVGPLGETEGVDNLMWEKFQEEVVSSLFFPDRLLLPPVAQPPPAAGSTLMPPKFDEPTKLTGLDSHGTGVSEQASMPYIGQAASLASSTRGIPAITLDTEIQKEVLCRLLRKLLREVNSVKPVMLLDALQQHINLGDITVGRYICDFGNVIIGQSKKKMFKITNASLFGQLSWLFDKKYLSASGFSIEPEKVNKLSEGESIDFVVKYFARTQQKVGTKTVSLPLQVAGSPTLQIIFSANVCLPEIELTSYSVDFGKVMLGQSARIFLGLYNPSPVTATWNFKHVNGKDNGRFIIQPSTGSLRPNKRAKIYIEFVPGEAKKSFVEYALKIDQNRKSRSLKVFGEGTTVSLKAEPGTIVISPVLPSSEGEDGIVTVVNTSNYPVEFFSLDFDSQYKEDEEKLEVITDYDERGIFRSSVREPGQPLPFDVLDAYHRALEMKEAAGSTEADQLANAEGLQSGDHPNGPLGEEGQTRQVTMKLKPARLRLKTSYRDRNQHQDIVVIGPPKSGVSTIVQFLSRKLLLSIKTIDMMLLDVAGTDSELGKFARVITFKESSADISERKAKEDQLRIVAEQSKLEVMEAFTKDKKNKGKEVPAELLSTPAVQDLEAFLNQYKASEERIADILRFRAQWIDMGDGIIVDGIGSDYIPPATALSALRKAFPGIIISTINIKGDWDGYFEWIEHILRTKEEEGERIKRVMETSKKQLFKLLKAAKGKTLDETIKELELSFAVAIPECLPSGDESWLDATSGQVVELESNDFKLLDDKEKEVYLRQLLYSMSIQARELNTAIQLIKANDLIHRELRKVFEDKQVDHTANVFSESTAGAASETPSDLSSIKMDFGKYVETIVPLFETVEKFASVSPLIEEDRLRNEEETIIEPVTEQNDPQISEGLKDSPMPGESSESVRRGGLVEILLEGDESIETVQQLFLALLPPPIVSVLEKENALPEMEIFQLYYRPSHRPNRRPMKRFKIVDMNDIIQKQVELPPALSTIEPEPTVKGKKGTAKDVKQAKLAAEEPQQVELIAPTPPPPAPTRWVIPAQGSIQFKVRFSSEKEGKFESTLEFEVVGGGQRLSLPCVGVCAYPSINGDTRNIFLRRLKALSPINPHPVKRFVIADNFYSFGALSLFKTPDWKKVISDSSTLEEKARYDAIEATNSDIIRISNNGLYRDVVSFKIVSDEEEENQNIFVVDPHTVEVEEGGTKEVRIWALPRQEKEYNASLAVTVKDNPNILQFPLKCWGTVASLDISGPWSEMLAKAEEALAKNTDKKLVKELEAKLSALKEAYTIDFDRVLLNKTENRTFLLTNTSLVAVAWEIGPESFADSPFISFNPLRGEIACNSSVEVTVSFKSSDARLLSGNFSLKYADTEGGLNDNRAVTKRFRVVAEAYSINAVSIKGNGDEITGSSELDFGLVRVGDFASQTLKMGNRGKYRIGYSFAFSKPYIQELITISPMEGTIETGNSMAEIKVTFCSKASEVILKSNSDVVVKINEPLTGEVVETFPLLVTVQSKFNTFRLQPSKGISFGAVRFDADARVKRAELRNESQFEITCLICPAIVEHDELDDLDNATFAAYAFAVPAAMRSQELGENYLRRLNPSEQGGKGAKKEKPATGKGKGKEADLPKSTLNPFVQDPDNLPCVPLPIDPLVVGAFTIHPRITTVLPGQSISIEVKFDPSGCDVAKEKLRICISGANPVDALTKILTSFELVGESCQPAIVCDDMASIFEEQEIVNSLAEFTGGKSSEGEGKLEKLPIGKVVYAESEKMLAFGPVCCSQSGRGVVERIRISNPTKIDIKAKFRIISPEEAAALSSTTVVKTPKDSKPKGKGSQIPPPETVLTSAFSVQPESWDIPPHEHRYVNIYFNPLEIKSYRSIFVAEIDDLGVSTNAAPKENISKRLTFNLGGSGTLPCISVDYPSNKDAEGKITLDFGKTLVQRRNSGKIDIRNDGVMAATCLFELIGPAGDFIFPAKGTSLLVAPGQKQSIPVYFAPREESVNNGSCTTTIKISVLNNPFDTYFVKLSGEPYNCDAVIENISNDKKDDIPEESFTPISSSDVISFQDINLSSGCNSVQSSILLRSRSNTYLKFEFVVAENAPRSLSFSPCVGHIAPREAREVTITFTSDVPLTLDNVKVQCFLRRISYKATTEDPVIRLQEENLWGKWDDNMKTIRPALPEDLKAINDYSIAIKEYEAKVETEKAKGKKAKPVGPPPEKCLLIVAPPDDNGNAMVYEIVPEPFHDVVEESPIQQLILTCNGTADSANFECEVNGQTLELAPTFMFQSTGYRFVVTNKSKICMPIQWGFEDMRKRKSSRPGSASFHGTTGLGALSLKTGSNGLCPFSIEPEECMLHANESQEFMVKFSPYDADEFVFACIGKLFMQNNEARKTSEENIEIKIMFRGVGRRPICHFEMEEARDYLSRRLPHLKNENGLVSSIESSDLRIVELESVGLKTRNTYRFHATNTTNESYEFLWEPMGDASPFWRCVQSAGMMFPGKRVEMVFEYVPEDINVAEAFFKFSINRLGLHQTFLFTGNVVDPKVSFSSSRIDFHSVMLGGEGMTETVYLVNDEHLPFHFSFDKYSLLQFDGPSGPVLKIDPRDGVVPPGGKIPLVFSFKPQEEVIYNYNLICFVKRKPNKLSINVKGEGYAVHPQIQLEQTLSVQSSENGSVPDNFILLKPLPAINVADFGSVQVLDSLTKSISILNAGKFNFDYSWNIDGIGNMLTLSGGKLNGTLLKGEELNYKLTFAPQREGSLDGSVLKFTVAGKYIYQVLPQGIAVKPALRFSFMRHDFGPCFITSPGGNTVIEEIVLVLRNHDPGSNISVECVFQKTRSLWVECVPTVIPPGEEIQVPIRFAPREVKDYTFTVPFLVNGTGKVQVQVSGKGINARLELVNGSQRRTSFGLVSVGSISSRTVVITNKSKKALPIQLSEGGEYGTALKDRFITFMPQEEFILAPKATMEIKMEFKPTKRVSQFNEDLLIQYAGIRKTLVSLAGKAQGFEVNLDTDSIPFGAVVLDSQKVKKLTLENAGDLTVTFQWDTTSFGQHFTITPLSGKVLPGDEMVFDVIFKPKFADDDIRQDNILLQIPGLGEGLKLTCSGACIPPPTENIQTLRFQSMARKEEIKVIKVQNPTEKDWFLSPSLQGIHWKVPYEFKVPAKSQGEMPVTYFPLTMASSEENAHNGKLFVALPDGSAQLYELKGFAGPPDCSGRVEVETPAKKATTVTFKVQNWLGEKQKLNVTIDIQNKPSPATFVVAANVTEVGPNGTKEFPVRFISFVEGASKAIITFTNPETREYSFYELVARATMSEVLETFNVEAPVRQVARAIITVENPLFTENVAISMGSLAKPAEWWTCDSKYMRVNELSPLSGNREGTFEVEFRPLVVTHNNSGNLTEHLVTIITQELGTFKYKICARATAPLLKQILRFSAPLGTVHREDFLFRAFNTVKTDYQCLVQKPDIFSVQKVCSVEAVTQPWEGDEVRLAVQYEPTEIGEIEDTLVVGSTDYGSYQCQLLGTCTAPMPQGPFFLDQGAVPKEISFRNCFSMQCVWSLSVDCTAFRIVQPTSFNNISINAKTEFKVSVTFEPNENQIASALAAGSIITGKLFITCLTKPSVPSWVYYLQGKVLFDKPTSPAGVKGPKKK